MLLILLLRISQLRLLWRFRFLTEAKSNYGSPDNHAQPPTQNKTENSIA